MIEFLKDNSSYVVLGITLLLWIGFFSYMMKLDKKVSKLEQEK